MPARAVHHQKRVNATAKIPGEIQKIRFHHFPVDPGQQAPMRFTGRRADRAKEINPFIIRLPKRARTTSALGPDARQGALLPEARLVLEPKFGRFSPMGDTDLFEGFGQRFF